MESRWGLVEQDAVAYLRAQLGNVFPQIEAGLAEAETDDAAKKFPALFVVWVGAARRGRFDTNAGGQFSQIAMCQYKLIIYASSGLTPDVSRYGTTGLFALMQRLMEKFNGFTPPSITDNAWFFEWASDSPATQWNTQSGTGGLKMEAVYELQQKVFGTIR